MNKYTQNLTKAKMVIAALVVLAMLIGVIVAINYNRRLNEGKEESPEIKKNIEEVIDFTSKLDSEKELYKMAVLSSENKAKVFRLVIKQKPKIEEGKPNEFVEDIAKIILTQKEKELDKTAINNVIVTEEKTTTWSEISEYAAYLDEKYPNVTLPMIYGVCKIESSFTSDVTSSAGCMGLMQLQPKYQVNRMKNLGLTNLYNPYDNLYCGVAYLDELISEYGYELGIRVYGVGAGNVNKPWAIKHMDWYLEKMDEYMEEYSLIYM